jgi:Rieske Fe-S protein
VSRLARRSFLRLAALVTGTAWLTGAGCRESRDLPPDLVLDLSELPEGVRVRREWAGRPVELLREGDTVTARSLLCTHQGCEVAWHAADRAYVCPCHDGRFDAAGVPLYGPPRRNLPTFPVVRRDGRFVLAAADGG